MGDLDREAILARRALFISSALSGLSCTAQPEPPSQPPPESLQPPVIVEVPNERPEVPTGSFDGERPVWSAVMAKAPPIAVPTNGLTANEQGLLTSLQSYHSGRYDRLRKVWEALPTCAPAAEDCAEWGDALEVVREMTERSWGALCGYSSEVTHTYLARDSAHDRYIAQLGHLLLADLDAAVEARQDPTDATEWARRRKVLNFSGRPCLSCAGPSAEPMTDAIVFGLDDVAIPRTDAAEGTLRMVVSTYQHNLRFKATVIVRGHADPNEPNPEALAQRRADAVTAQLVKRGVSRKHIDVRNYAAALPISSDPASPERNARVDFEVVEP